VSDTSNVGVVPNVVLDVNSPVIRYLPGDFAVLVYKPLWISVEVIKKNLTGTQYNEYLQYLVCVRCRRPCAGTCSR
jgi:hypothetical protein